MKMSIRKMLLSLTLLVPALQQTACADNVTYLYRSWNEGTKTVTTETRTANATPLHSVAKNGEWMGLGDGWYYMEGDRINIQTLNILGTDVHLILGDGTTLECYGGIKLEEGHKLTIYGQSEGDGAGFLWAHQGTDTYIGYKNASGIGGGEAAFIGTLEIHSGRIKADGGAYGAGIGHGAFDSNSKTKYTGKIIVYGGTINATGGQSGAGIGSGSGHYDDENDSPEYIQYGGTVTCTGGDNAAGLGGGGGFYKIWGNSAAQGGQIWKATINGGTLTATGGKYGAGIGSGNKSGNKGGEIIINGGTVTATGGVEGAGIGGTSQSYSPVITINGGNVKAYGKGAGIGSGCYSSPTEFNMYGGTVYAEGGIESAGVGGGKNNYGGKISIFGGTLEAVSGEMPYDADHYRAFGSGNLKDNNDFQDTRPGIEYRRNFLYLGDETHFVKVRIGNSKTELGTQYSLAANRKNDCRTHFHAKVETCNHDDDGALSYTQVDDKKHHKYCKYCGYTEEVAHTYTDGKCVCGKEGNNEPETWTVTIYQATSSSSTSYGDGKEYKVLKGQQFPVPAPDAIEGLTFMQWMQNPDSAPESIEMKDDDIDAGLEITPTGNTTLYAQYRYNYNEEWTWSADHTSATVTLKQGGTVVQSDIAAEITPEEQDATESKKGYKRYYATAKWKKAPDITYQATDVFETTHVYSLTLQDNADNDDLIWENRGAQVHEVELSGRTIYRDGNWNTLVLPFDIDDLSSGTALSMSDLDLRTLSTSSYDATTKTLKLTFTEATKIEAGKPYIIRSKYEHINYTELSDPVFTNVTINATDNSVQTEVVDFIGTYSAIELDASMTDVLYLGSNNTLRWPKGNTRLKSCRAAFVLKGAAAGADAAATRVLIDFGDGEVTGIETLERIPVLTGEDSNVFYTLDGRRMTGSQLPRGIYINKGKKVIIK